ncbi:MAG: SDR family oxidoreductase [Betaproteobacteria bacterium]|nr:SDR family oxidoreductase [Betaproteobacteria bacterium]
MTLHRILIVGATGLAGAQAVRHFAALPDWTVTALSRRAPPAHANVTHLALDLTDAKACRKAFATAAPCTHVLYAALYEENDLQASWCSAHQQNVNLIMLRNVLDGVEAGGKLKHFTILQGGKAYGSHLGRVPVPAKERWPRMAHDIFYWQQEDLLRERARAGGWVINVLRPQMILGHALGSPMNMIAAIGVYAAVLREAGEPLYFPGGDIYVTACCDSRLIAQATEFCASTPAVAGETFNVVNGDAVVYQDMWPAIAAHFNMPVGEAKPTQLATHMPRRAHEWERIVAKHGLAPLTMHGLVGASWQFADLTFAYGKAGVARAPDRLMSPIKLRKAGFAGCEDTEDAVIYWLDQMQQAQWLPR